MKYFVPSKTFLTGEYSVLVGGSALGLATSPQFEISYLNHPTTFQFHEDSPAGLYLKNKKKSVNVHLHDPYAVRGVQGGFGKSTAEYFSVLIPDLIGKKKTAEQIREDYVSMFTKEKVRPSGVDLVIQYLGEVAYVNPSEHEYRSLSWKFEDLNFLTISTGLKIKTHEHLEKLNLGDLNDLPQYSNQVIDAYLNKTSSDFVTAMKSWVQILQKRGLTAPASREMKEALEKIQGVQLAKPCGALGADVILVFCEQSRFSKVQAEVRKQKFKIQASRDDLTEGLMKYVG